MWNTATDTLSRIERGMRLVETFKEHWLQSLVRTQFFAYLYFKGVTADNLTLARLRIGQVLFAFYVIVVLLGRSPDFPGWMRGLLMAIYTIAFLTDLLDGAIARRRQEMGLPESGEGAHRDPRADKVLTIPPFVYNWLYFRWETRIVTMLSVVGDLWATWIRRQSARQGIVIPSNSFGRYKMVFLCMALSCQLIWYPKAELVVLIFLVVSLTCGVISVIGHAAEFRRKLADRHAAREVSTGARS